MAAKGKIFLTIPKNFKGISEKNDISAKQRILKEVGVPWIKKTTGLIFFFVKRSPTIGILTCFCGVTHLFEIFILFYLRKKDL